jgi:transposase
MVTPTTVAEPSAQSSGSPDGTGSPERPRKQAPCGAKALPAHLERREVVVPVPPEQRSCPCCGEERTPMGEEVSQRLELEPARFFILVEKRPKAGPRPEGCRPHLPFFAAPRQPIPEEL